MTWLTTFIGSALFKYLVVPALAAGALGYAYYRVTDGAYERGAAAERVRAAEVQKKRSEDAAAKGEAYRRMPRSQLDEALRKKCLEYGGTECGP